MFNIKKFVNFLCIILTFFINSSESLANQTCIAPNGTVGTCISIIDCAPLLEVLKNAQRQANDTELLQKSQCDQIEKMPYVCCGVKTESRMQMPNTMGGVNLLPPTRDCGKSFNNRIYGGNVTRIDEYPWLALIEYTKPENRKGFHCGGALINKRYILTAAHCVTGRMIPAGWSVTGIRLGEWDRSTTRDCQTAVNNRTDCSDPHLDLGIEEIIYHADYDSYSTNKLNDIALIRLNKDVTFTDFVGPICLPHQTQWRSKTFEGAKMDITGFGITETGSSSNLKLKATVDVSNFSTCRQKYATRGINLHTTQMCAGGQIGVDSCGGDSGGPLVTLEKVDNRSVYLLAGIVSFGPNPCALSGWPGIYTRTGDFIDWIFSNMKA